MVKTHRAIALTSVAVLALLAACDAVVEPSAAPRESAPPKPAVQIDQTWTAANGEWTFTGRVDPHGDPTDVVLEVGPGPATARQFDQQIPVAEGLVDAGPVTVTTRDIPDIDEICVRFSATSEAGTSVTSPLCVPHDLPSIVVDAAPPIVTFSAPATGTTEDLTGASYEVAWSEEDEGTGISRRSIQRRSAPFVGGTCGTFEDDGPALTGPGPLAVSDLADATCYEWVATVSDQAGNATTTTSGTVRVALVSA